MNEQPWHADASNSPEREFDALFDAHYVVIRRYAQRRLAEVTMAEDIAAETFAAAWNQIRTRHTVDLAWLFTVAHRRIADVYRDRGRFVGVEAAIARAAQERAEPLHPLESLALHQVLAQLPEKQREVVMLHYWDGRPAAEIGAIVGTTERAVWMTLSRARKTLRELLGDNESIGEQDDR